MISANILSSIPIPSLLDLCILSLLSITAFHGFYKGLLYEAMRIICITLTLGTSLAIFYYNPKAFANNPTHINLAILGMFCLITMPLFWSILRMISFNTRSSILFNFNRILGSILSISQFLALLLFLESAIGQYSPEYNILKQSELLQYAKTYQTPLFNMLKKINIGSIKQTAIHNHYNFTKSMQ